jgi:hypothetical protein
MQKLLTLAFFIWMLTAGCTSTNKNDTDNSNTDTSGYKEQPQDQTRVNDTLTIQTDSMNHNDSIPH